MTDLSDEIAATIRATGLSEIGDAELIIDTTAERLLSAPDCDDAREAMRAQLWAAWDRRGA